MDARVLINILLTWICLLVETNLTQNLIVLLIRTECPTLPQHQLLKRVIVSGGIRALARLVSDWTWFLLCTKTFCRDRPVWLCCAKVRALRWVRWIFSVFLLGDTFDAVFRQLPLELYRLLWLLFWWGERHDHKWVHWVLTIGPNRLNRRRLRLFSWSPSQKE